MKLKVLSERLRDLRKLRVQCESDMNKIALLLATQQELQHVIIDQERHLNRVRCTGCGGSGAHETEVSCPFCLGTGERP